MLAHVRPSSPRFTSGTRPIFNGSAFPESLPGTGQGPPSAQSLFAHNRHYLLYRGVLHHVSGSYPSFVAPTGSCASPNSSQCLRLSLIHQVFAGCCQPLLEDGPSRRCLCESFPGCLGFSPGGTRRCSCSFLPVWRRPSPRPTIGSAPTMFPSATSEGVDFREDRHSQCSGLQVCLPPRSLPPLRFSARRAAVAFTSEQNACRYPHAHRIC